MQKKKIIWAFLFLVIISCAYAKEDFSASGKDVLGVCPCSTNADTILIENTGDSSSTYTIFVDNGFSDWVKISPNNFILNPGQATYVTLSIAMPCDSKGDYDFTVYISTGTGLAKGLKQKLTVMPCFDFSIQAGGLYEPKEGETAITFKKYEGIYSICAGTSNIVPILIKNNASIDNSYQFLSMGADFVSSNVKAASLKPNQQGIILLNLNPAKNVEGDFDVFFSSKSDIGAVSKAIDLEVKVEKCYDLQVEFSKQNDSICGCEPVTYTVNVDNKGKSKENLSFELFGAEWANMSITSALINPGTQRKVNVMVYPSCEESGKYELEFMAIGNKINGSDKLILDITPQSECYKAEIVVDSSIQSDYSGIIIPVSIENKGTKKASYDIKIDAPGWVSLSPEILTINPGKKGNVNLKVMPGKNVEKGEYIATINVNKGEAKYSKEITIKIQESLVIKNMEKWFLYYKYYFYAAFFLLAIILLLITPVKNRIQKYKEKAEEKRMKEEEKEQKRLERERKKIERMGKKTIQLKAKKEIVAKSNGKRGFMELLAAIFIIAVIVCVGYLAKRSGFLTSVQNFLSVYWLYLIIGVLAFILFLLLIRRGKRGKKTKKSNFSRILKWIMLLVVLGIIAAFIVYYEIYSYFSEFFMAYMYYIIAGFVILVILILLLTFLKGSDK